jgi:hypothetical protein
MPTITNFGDVVTQGNTTATGNLVIQGTGTSAFSSASSAVIMAGTLAVSGVTQHSSNIIPSGDYACGIGTAAQRFTNIFSANTNVYNTANILTANINSSNVTNIASFQNSVYHFQNTFLTGYTSTTGVIQPSSTGISGLGSVSFLFANAYLQTANIGSATLQQSVNVIGNVFVSNSINVTNVLSNTTNASFLNVLNYANIINLNVFTSTNTGYLTVTTLSNIANANILTANNQFLNVVTANIQNLNVTTGANTTWLNVSQIANVANANILTANAQFLNVVTANILNLNVTTGANTTWLNVSQIANVANANILTGNTQFFNSFTSNILNLNVSTGSNTTYLTVSTLANAFSANILTANNQFLNVVTANILNLNVSTGTNTSWLNVSQIANVANANILTANAQFLNVVTANILNLNVLTGANTTWLNVSQIANVANANILTANMQFSNTVTANILNLNVSTGSNTTYLTVSTLANAFSANIITANIRSENTVTANILNLNVSTGANTTYLTVSTFSNIASANIVTQFSSNINVSSNANLFNTNIFTANVQSVFNAVYAVMTGNYYGNASGVSNLNLSNVNNGTLPFSTTVGAGAAGISINGVTGSAGQFITATGTGSAIQWGGPAATVIWSQVTGFASPPIYYAVSNVGIGGPYSTMSWGYGTSSVNQYPGTPLDVYGGTGSFSNLSDATYTGSIRIQQNAGTWSANGGLEFKTGTDVNGSGHRIVTTQDPTIGSTPLIFQLRAKTKTWSNAVVINCDTTATSGYVGIGTMVPLYQLHIYQPNTSATTAGALVQGSSASQQVGYTLQNSAAGTCVFYLNGASPSDGAANSATIRNNAGDLRLAAQSTNPYIYLQNSTSNVGINTTTATQQLDVAGYARIGSSTSDTARLILGRSPGTTNFDYSSVIESVSTFASNYQSTLKFYTHGTATTGADPTLAMTINPTQQVGIGVAPSYKFHVDNGSGTGVACVHQASAITAGQNTSMILGKALTTYNSATILWNHVGEGLATNYLGFGYYGGDNKLCVTASGTVGIGATNPSDLFHILGTSNPSIRIDAGASGTTDPRLHFYSGSTFRGRVAYSYSGSYMYYQNDTQDVMRHYNGSTGAVVLQPVAGNVGIGNVSPGYKLDVSGTCNVTGDSRVAGQLAINNSTPTITFQDTDHMTAYWHCNSNLLYLLRGGVNVGYGSWATVNGVWPVYWDLSNNNAYFGGSINMIGNSTRIQFNSTSTWSGDAGTSFGKLEYHAERWYVNAGSNSDRIVQFRRAGSDVSYVDNSGTYVGNGLSGGAVSATTGTFSSTLALTETNANLGLNRGAVWFNGNGDTNHYLYNNYNNRDGAGAFDGMKWNAYNGLWVRGGASGANTGLFVNSSGNVGIGTTTVNGRMNIYEATGSGAGTTSGTLTLDHGNNYGSSSIVFPSRINYGSDYGYIQYNDTRGGAGETANMIIGTSNDGDDHVSLMPAGNVGINTLTPGYKLEIQGNDYATGGRYTSDYFRVYGGGGLYNETYGGGWYMSDYTWMRVNNDKWIYTGGVIASANDIIAYYSDMRLKKNIEPITNALDKIKTLSTFTYETNELGASFGLEEHVRNSGFSAQEVQKIMPEVVRLAPFDMGVKNEVTGVLESKSGENYMTLQYDKMAPLIVAALKEEVQKREDLEKEMAELKQIVQNLLNKQ